MGSFNESTMGLVYGSGLWARLIGPVYESGYWCIYESGKGRRKNDFRFYRMKLGLSLNLLVIVNSYL